MHWSTGIVCNCNTNVYPIAIPFLLDVLVTDYAISILTLVFNMIYYDARSVFTIVFCITIPPLSFAPTSV